MKKRLLQSLSAWAALFSVVLPAICTSSSFFSSATSSSTSSTTSRSSSSQQHRALRADFVKAMDEATGRHRKHNAKQESSFLSRLADMATPAHAYPGYDDNADTSSRTLFSTETARTLEEYQNYGINLTQYALKYIGCSNIKTWSDQEAAEGNSVLKTDRFVVLRLCPRDSCSNYNEYGCLEQFGDYLIPMEIYLQIMAETFFTQYQEYCETCYECMTGQQANNNNNNQNYNNGNGYGNNNQNYNNNNNNNNGYNNNGYNNQNYNNNNNNGGNRQMDQAGDDAWYKNWNGNNKNYYGYNDDGGANNYNNVNGNDDAWYNANKGYGDDAANAQQGDDNYNNNQQYDCDNYAACENYETACQDYTNFAFDMMDYFQCAEFNVGGGVGYMGPHCASDGKTISMGVFSDENCYEFSADLKDMSSYMQVSDSELSDYTSANCISCLASDGYTLNVDNNADGYADVSDICGELYGEAAKCNKYMGNAGNYSSANQEAQEKKVCNFIKNLLSNSYDEYGEVYLKTEEGWMNYVPDIAGMPKWQKYTLSASVLLTVALLAYACYLYRQLTQRKFVWYPRARKGYSSSHPGEPTAIGNRMHSGIISGRSRSSNDFELKNGGLLS